MKGDPGLCPPTAAPPLRSMLLGINIKSMPLPCPACGRPAAKSSEPLTLLLGEEEDGRMGTRTGSPLQPPRTGTCDLGPHIPEGCRSNDSKMGTCSGDMAVVAQGLWWQIHPGPDPLLPPALLGTRGLGWGMAGWHHFKLGLDREWWDQPFWRHACGDRGHIGWVSCVCPARGRGSLGCWVGARARVCHTAGDGSARAVAMGCHGCVPQGQPHPEPLATIRHQGCAWGCWCQPLPLLALAQHLPCPPAPAACRPPGWGLALPRDGAAGARPALLHCTTTGIKRPRRR